jgi:hypothetical protein
MQVRSLVVALAITFGAVAHAQVDPMEQAVDGQVSAVAPAAARMGAFVKNTAEKTDWMSPLEVGKCYWFSGVGGPGVKKLALFLWGPDGKRITEVKSPGPSATLAFCPPFGGMFHLQAKIQGGGPYVVGTYVGSAQQALPPPPAVAGIDLGGIIDQQAQTGAVGAHRVGGFLEGAGGAMAHTDWPTALEAGRCYWFIGAGTPGAVKQLALYLWGPDGKRVTESKHAGPTPVIGHCPTAPGMYKVQAKIASGSGAYKVGVFVK